jgi:uncharacterized protein
MDRVDSILKSKKFIKYLNKNIKMEKKRKFCKHNMIHFMEVARVMYIINLENIEIINRFSKDIIYATALLHDIGRWKQYKDGSEHAEVGAKLCIEILDKSGFNNEEKELISEAILNHRNNGQDKNSLNWLLYEADKKSRLCYACEVLELCYRFDEYKKPKLIY